jgi:hypothetical protein
MGVLGHMPAIIIIDNIIIFVGKWVTLFCRYFINYRCYCLI